MAATKTKRDPEMTGFHVTCTIGRVTFGDGDVSPHVAAFQLIAEHGAPGEFHFPAPDGSMCIVTVEFTERQL
jgi:hypothetical protein